MKIDYSWLLNYMDLNCVGPLIHKSFSINMFPWISCVWIQAVDPQFWLYAFIYLCHLIYRTWASSDFGICWVFPHGCHETTVTFWGSQKLYTDFQLHRSSTLALTLFKGQLYLNLFCSVGMTLVNFKLIVKMRFKNVVNSCSIRFPIV